MHPLNEQKSSVANWRQIGLGIMGLADCLIKLEMTYGDEKSIEFCDNLGKMLFEDALYGSSLIAEVQGDYPMFNKDAVNKSNILRNHGLYVDNLRNSQLLTIAPTGSISSMLGVSGGIEPIFAKSYTRKTQSLHGEDKIYKVYTPIIEKYMKENHIYDEKDLPDYFVTSEDIEPENRIQMQAVWQEHIDASISSTINLPEAASIEDIVKIYTLAWEYGLKGVTVYRKNCARSGVLVDTSKDANVSVKKNKKIILNRGDIIVADNNVIGLKRKLQTGCGSLHVQAFFDPETGLLLETYLSKGSTGGCNNFMIGLSRTISLLARGGIALEDIVDQLNSTGVCPSYATRKAVKKDTSPGSCCPMAVGKALLDMQNQIQDWIENKDRIIPNESKPKEVVKINKCPQCGEELIQEGGCIICKNCGWSKCD